MQRDDPGSISTEEVKAIGSRYGVDFNQTQVGDLQQIYSEFLMALIPTDETSLTYACLPMLFACLPATVVMSDVRWSSCQAVLDSTYVLHAAVQCRPSQQKWSLTTFTVHYADAV